MKRREKTRPSAASAMMTMDHAWDRVGKEVITKQALYLAAERGDFPTVRCGRRVLVPRQAFEAWLTGTKPSTTAA